MDDLGFEVLDCLIDDEEQIEEIYLAINFERSGDALTMRPRRFRLAEISLALGKLEADELVVSKYGWGYSEADGPVARVYSLTPKGRSAWRARVEGEENVSGAAPG